VKNWKEICEAGMIPGCATHNPAETIPFLESSGLDIKAYLAPVNPIGEFMGQEPDKVIKIIENAKKPVIGSLNGLPAHIRRATYPGNDFKSMPAPGPHDWLAHHPEPGQTYEEYKYSKPVKPDNIRNIIYLRPIGKFPEGRSPSLKTLKGFAGAYFNIDVKILPALSLSDHNITTLTTRINNFTGKRQILTGDILALLQKNIPSDAYCVLAITMEDLYPDPTWNFVFGQASLHDRVGVFSFARYDPLFYGEARAKDYDKILLFRSCKVLAHETGHMFGMYHCIYYQCCMNGSNHLKESDSRPIHLCPVCLRKLYYSIGFDINSRYRELSRFYKKTGFKNMAQWIDNRLVKISE